MASKYGLNATKRDSNVPAEKIDVNEQHGRMRVAHDEYTLTAVLGTADSLYMMELPAGAKLYDAEISSDDLGTTGILDVGWEASADGGEVADPNGIYAALDVKAAAIARQKMANSVGGFLKEFSEKVKIVIVPSEASSLSAGTIKLTVWYVVD